MTHEGAKRTTTGKFGSGKSYTLNVWSLLGKQAQAFAGQQGKVQARACKVAYHRTWSLQCSVLQNVLAMLAHASELRGCLCMVHSSSCRASSARSRCSSARPSGVVAAAAGDKAPEAWCPPSARSASCFALQGMHGDGVTRVHRLEKAHALDERRTLEPEIDLRMMLMERPCISAAIQAALRCLCVQSRVPHVRI